MIDFIDDLGELLAYLETTSLEPHDDYTSEFTYKEQKILYEYITKLENDKTKLQNNWNELKKWLEENKFNDNYESYQVYNYTTYGVILKKMQELED
jgi:hypothetical protein